MVLYNFFEFLRRAIVIILSGLWRASKYRTSEGVTYFCHPTEIPEAVITLNKSPTFRFTDEQFGTFFFRWCLV